MNKDATTWTKFWDMHSGGGTKEPPYEYIYIEAPRAEAEVIFANRFGHSANRVSCTCCGNDYSVDSGTLQQLTAYHRGCRYDETVGGYVEEQETRPWVSTPLMTLDAYLAQPDVLAIRGDEITPEQRQGTVPTQGYVWVEES